MTTKRKDERPATDDEFGKMNGGPNKPAAFAARRFAT
jgi:hypothetical protein